MRYLLAILICLLFGAAALAQDDFAGCVLPREMRELVAANKYVAPTAALVTARRSMPNADILRADLCRRDGAFVYVIIALRKDGKAVEVLVDAASGKVIATP